MWTENEIIEYLKKNLKESRFKHSLSVRDTAVKLAEKYNCDVKKASIAGLAHDCAKNIEDKEIINICSEAGYILNEVELKNPSIAHGLAGSIIAKDKMGINDEEILNSIRFHTTGKKNMTLLEKIIYIADYVEPLRDFPGVDELRKAVNDNLDEAMLLSFDQTIKYVIKREMLIHLDTVEARNYMIYNKE
ncbi:MULTISPECIES: bis(5'-nucleosyl)-tetraphosphatase (symmetrical) YqeK [Clostridium]|uniref:bis(5'-nucleosyl)-tetraphosphatase (symmetrical) YqeK n=1 Tax=Clostridium TaxID=1485 RepID=UPI00069FC8BA|nr:MULTISPECIES: bis(5'-nucleosyl)-tetraphosphatase (symmetrical) YqeK [Clostridium]KOF56731.1 phosphohydrolase [Clostridium sp. DMHC 10]MCD2347544.1 bis(5'-nucleosyl)-tetraphosphatase (symmetrical) YqeK [Clostridium guangxiense]